MQNLKFKMVLEDGTSNSNLGVFCCCLFVCLFVFSRENKNQETTCGKILGERMNLRQTTVMRAQSMRTLAMLK